MLKHFLKSSRLESVGTYLICDLKLPFEYSRNNNHVNIGMLYYFVKINDKLKYVAVKKNPIISGY